MAPAPPTLLLSRSVIASLTTTRDYLAAMQDAFLGLAAGRYSLPDSLRLPGTGDGAFHVKSAARLDGTPLVVVKVNGNFPGNPAAGDLPTIQGVVVLFDAARGCVLAILDSVEITARRTAAASALAARHLARPGARTLGLVGCGLQARYHIEALLDVAPLDTVQYCDPRDGAAGALAARAGALGLRATRVADAPAAARGADIVVTVTTATRPVLAAVDLAPGCFVAGVGADSPAKHELAPDLLRDSRVVVDGRAAAVASGDVGHAIRAGAMTAGDIHAELAEVVSGRVPGRSSDEERWVFDSTGLAVEDHAAAAMIFERARGLPGVPSVRFDDAEVGS
jgi:ornithine cyclodeaminase/alanine dehydrogenase-like protein (mu-crystallin family)